MSLYKAPRGTTDILAPEQAYWRYIEEKAVSLCELYGYQRIDTPVFEDARLFVRRIGSGTDIVEKETYSFEDRGGTLLTLRPEGTAPVCRAYLERGLYNLPQPVKLYYWAPIFRYERPQAGRYRQHQQFGFEAIGDSDPALDGEIMAMAWQLYTDLRIPDLTLVLNSIGCPKCRPGYLEKLKAHYIPYRDNICEDCLVRLTQNPLRLLDCKEPTCQPVADSAPHSTDYLCPECREHFEQVKKYLNLLGIAFVLSHRLVRGFDYYTKTVFEFQPKEEGAQSTIGAGGRYDGLIEELGGKPTPAVGFATGIERIILNLKKYSSPIAALQKPKIYVAYQGQAAKDAAFKLAAQLRALGKGTNTAFGQRSLKAQLRQANTLGAQFAVIIGDEELEKKTLTIKDMSLGHQQTLAFEEAITQLKEVS